MQTPGGRRRIEVTYPTQSQSTTVRITALDSVLGWDAYAIDHPGMIGSPFALLTRKTDTGSTVTVTRVGPCADFDTAIVRARDLLESRGLPVRWQHVIQ